MRGQLGRAPMVQSPPFARSDCSTDLSAASGRDSGKGHSIQSARERAGASDHDLSKLADEIWARFRVGKQLHSSPGSI
jgi:hypothetical protein